MNKEIIKLTEKEFRDIIMESVNKILKEGIVVDTYDNVTMTDKHEKLVDTSVENNPTLLKDFVKDINVWSVFKRKDDDWGDGNPLLYALKNEKGYKLTNPQKVYNRIEYVVKKIFESQSNMDVTIAVPSKNKLNHFFAKIVSKYCQNPKYIDNVLVKMSTEEVYDYIKQKDSAFRQFYGNFYPQKITILKGYFRNMTEGYFQFHKVYDMEMRKQIEHTIKLSDEFYGKYIDAINDKNVLIIDDSLTLGQTIKESCKIISEAYTPKSISVLTLFSPLYCEGGNELKK